MSVILTLSVIAQLLFSQPGLVLVETDAQYSGYGEYNQYTDELLYFGVSIDSVDGILYTKVSVESDSGDNLVVIDEAGYDRAIGWLDSNLVLLHKTYPKEGSTSFFDVNRKLFVCNSVTNSKYEIEDLPLDFINGQLAVGYGGWVFYQTLYNDLTTKVFHYDIYSGEKKELSILRNLDINLKHFAPDMESESIYFSQSIDDRYMLQVLKDGEITDILVSDHEFSYLTLDPRSNELYFIAEDGTDFDYQQVLKSYNAKTGDLKSLYAFERGINCLNISPYKEGSVLLSLQLPNDKSSSLVYHPIQEEVTIDINLNRQLYELKVR